MTSSPSPSPPLKRSSLVMRLRRPLLRIGDRGCILRTLLSPADETGAAGAAGLDLLIQGKYLRHFHPKLHILFFLLPTAGTSSAGGGEVCVEPFFQKENRLGQLQFKLHISFRLAFLPFSFFLFWSAGRGGVGSWRFIANRSID